MLSSVAPQPATAPDAAPATLVTWDDKFTHDFTQPEVYAFGVRAGVFGYNAPDWATMPYAFRQRVHQRPAREHRARRSGRSSTWTPCRLRAAGRSTWTRCTRRSPRAHSSCSASPAPVRSCTRSPSAVPSGQAKFAISAKSSYVTLDREDGLAAFDRREVTVHAATRLLTLAEAPTGGTVAGRELDLTAPAPLAAGQPVLITGTSDGGQVIQQTRIDQVAGASVTLANDLSAPMDRESVRIAGNVVLATHGETVADEVLGSGDGTASNQRFTLRKPNLTHVAAKTPSGVADSLEIRVDGVLWTEVPSLYPAGPHDRVYVVRIADDATATVIFGDGAHGARLPTGQENVHARYRSGIGPDGLVDAHALTLLPQRPLGVATVDNPLPSGGASAPETLAEARTNAPLTVLTLDRVVSLADYEDYARSFGGIAKARAIALPGASVPTVFITVAGPGGSAVQQTDDRRSARRPGHGPGPAPPRSGRRASGRPTSGSRSRSWPTRPGCSPTCRRRCGRRSRRAFPPTTCRSASR